MCIIWEFQCTSWHLSWPQQADRYVQDARLLRVWDDNIAVANSKQCFAASSQPAVSWCRAVKDESSECPGSQAQPTPMTRYIRLGGVRLARLWPDLSTAHRLKELFHTGSSSRSLSPRLYPDPLSGWQPCTKWALMSAPEWRDFYPIFNFSPATKRQVGHPQGETLLFYHSRQGDLRL